MVIDGLTPTGKRRDSWMYGTTPNHHRGSRG